MNPDNTELLKQINTPADLRKLQVSELPQVCDEIRHFIINTLAHNPGHFGSSMGAVELTVALHYVFDTPYDRIVWDVGHQAYGHKILTERRDRFYTCRKLNGLSGFPNPAESEYDAFIAGHASNSISAALGMAIATQLKHEQKERKVIAVIGDASIAGGLAFEGLNNASISPNNLLIILNDNDMAIDHNVGGLNEYLVNITTSKSYNKLRYDAYRTLRKLNLIDDEHRGAILRFNNSLKALLTKQQNIFEGLNIRYFGPIDGHNVVNIVNKLNDIKDMTGPKILHLRTIKGKGYAPAEKEPTIWHAPGCFNPETGDRITVTEEQKPPKFQDVFGLTLVELAKKNDKITVITPAMPTGSSTCFMMEKFPERSFDVGISEEHAVTFAAGLQHLFDFSPKRIRRSHSRCRHTKLTGNILYRPRWTRGRRRGYPSRCIRYVLFALHTQYDYCCTYGRTLSATSHVHSTTIRPWAVCHSLSSRLRKSCRLGMPYARNSYRERSQAL